MAGSAQCSSFMESMVKVPTGTKTIIAIVRRSHRVATTLHELDKALDVTAPAFGKAKEIAGGCHAPILWTART